MDWTPGLRLKRHMRYLRRRHWQSGRLKLWLLPLDPGFRLEKGMLTFKMLRKEPTLD